MTTFADTDLILNADGSVYHLNLLPEDIADIVITVGDPSRVSEVSFFFDRIEVKKSKREFVTHTGYIGNQRLSVISTGIGTDNIDIVINELDALANIDLKTREPKQQKKSLTIVRIGTSGALQKDIPVDSVLISEFAIGLDSLMHYYALSQDAEEMALQQALADHFKHLKGLAPYVNKADKDLLERSSKDIKRGITITTPGFYAPQGRKLIAKSSTPDLLSLFRTFLFEENQITNLEMETAGIYSLAKVLGHKALSVNAILANRVTNEFSKSPEKVINKAIGLTLKNLL